MNKFIRIIIKIAISFFVVAIIHIMHDMLLKEGSNGIPFRFAIIAILWIAIWSYKPKSKIN